MHCNIVLIPSTSTPAYLICLCLCPMIPPPRHAVKSLISLKPCSLSKAVEHTTVHTFVLPVVPFWVQSREGPMRASIAGGPRPLGAVALTTHHLMTRRTRPAKLVIMHEMASAFALPFLTRPHLSRLAFPWLTCAMRRKSHGLLGCWRHLECSREHRFFDRVDRAERHQQLR